MAQSEGDFVKVPRGIDDPVRILWWRVDEFVPVMVGLLVGFIVQQLLLCSLIGLICIRYYKRFNNSAADGLPLHFFYWCGYVKGKGWSFINPFIRRFYP
ncbi:type IV conjugative transfer system protein TraL [Alcanivorax sp.]|uniref:type IV conjugative transfer system protein TraL n=1 Tax=Alcanivorax sp. TaxID=1872427 RepID=UPI00258F0136|nr:type IV conjugative transfer system protein TraL [Alcanivorax sp.]